MNKTTELKHLIIILGAVTHAKPDLLSAIELATDLRAELQALYIEDLNLFRMVELPMAEEVARSTGQSRKMDLARLERLLRSQAYQIEQALTEIITEKEIACQFKIVRGHMAKEIVSAGTEENLVFISESRGLLKDSFLIEKILKEMIHRIDHATVFFQQHRLLSRGFEHRIAMIYDGTSLSDRALDLAQTIFPLHRNELFVIIPSDDSKKSKNMKLAVKKQLNEHPHLKIHSLPVNEILEVLLEMDKRQQLTSIILPINEKKVKQWNLEEVLSRFKCNVILMK